jgi:hypothetical protein
MNVYLIWEEGTSYYKIGISRNPAQRLKEIQTGNASQVHLVAEIPVSNANYKEKEFHDKYKRYQVSGEWFSFPPRVISEVLTFFNVYTSDELNTSKTGLLEKIVDLKIQLELEQRNTEFQMDKVGEYSVSLDYWFRKANSLRPDDQYRVGVNSEGQYTVEAINRHTQYTLLKP